MSILTSIQSRLEKANVLTEFDGPELQGFAAAFGLRGKSRKGDGEAITSDWCLLVKGTDATKAVALMKKAGFEVESQEADGYISFSNTVASGNFSIDAFKKGEYAMTVSNKG